jgi:DNA-binding transcriptional regulator YdaS (Cro superfamily)
MDITLALQRAVRAFPHGTNALAARLGISPTSLSHKVSTTYPAAHCSPEEVLEIMQATGDVGALQAMADALGFVLIPLPKHDAHGDEAMATMMKTVKEFGDFVSEASNDLADGRISDNELARVEREGAEALGAIQALLAFVAGMNQAGKPAQDA